MKSTTEYDPLTMRQRAVYDFIVSETMSAKHGPSCREIAAHIGAASPNAAMCHLRALEKKGMIRLLSNGKTRSIAIVNMSRLAELRDKVVSEAVKYVNSNSNYIFLIEAVAQYESATQGTKS